MIWVAMEFFFCFFLEFLEVFLHLLSTLFVFFAHGPAYRSVRYKGIHIVTLYSLVE